MRKIVFITLLFSYFLLFLPSPVRAAFGTAAACVVVGDVPSLGCLADVIVNIISFALSLLGVLTVIFFLLGSLRLVISRGDAKALEGAKKTITYALMGFFLVFFSLLIINFVSTSLGLGNILTKFTLYIGSGAPGSTSGTGSGGSNPGGGNPGGGGGGGGSGFN